jgi:RNA 3'-terminal phosphate cyclase (ATP)
MDIRKTESSVAVGTAGSIPLVIQAWLPVALVKGGVLEVTGGTEVPASPTIDYLEKVMIPALGAQGKGISVSVIRRGYYPSGGGIVQMKVKSADPERILITKEITCGIHSCSSGLPPHVAERQASSAKMLLCNELSRDIPVDIRRSHGVSKGSSCTAWCGAKGASSLGRPGLPAEMVGEAAATDLIREIRSPGEVDSHLSDQLLLYLARFGGTYTAPVYTLHARTMCWLLSLFGFEIHVREGEEVEFSA